MNPFDAFHQPGVPIPETAPDDPRVGRLLGRRVDGMQSVRAVLVGFPSDEGVRRNGGRPGAAGGPRSIREALYRMTPDARLGEAMTDLLGCTVDLGDVAVTGDLEADQQRLGAALAPWLEQAALVVVLGGGHETAYGHFLGYVEAGRSVSILNWDAHADVRPVKEGRAHSGSPFRQALEHPSGRCAGYTVAGLLPHSTAAAHLAYLREHGARVFWRDELDATVAAEAYAGEDRLMVTFDLDAVDQAEAPGVSAPAVGGMPAARWLRAAREAGRCSRVGSVDVVELNPGFDVDGRTARLAALTVWQVLQGVAERPPAPR